MLLIVGFRAIEVDEFEGLLPLMFHIRELRWNAGEIDAERNRQLSLVSSMLWAAGLTGS